MSTQGADGKSGTLVKAESPEEQRDVVRQFLDNSALDGLEATSKRTRNQIEQILSHTGDAEELRHKLIANAKES